MHSNVNHTLWLRTAFAILCIFKSYKAINTRKCFIVKIGVISKYANIWVIQ